MRIIVWILRIVVFLVVLAFAIKNTASVPVHFFGDVVLENVPLIIVMLVAFIAGLILGLLIMLLGSMRKQRELNGFNGEVAHLEERLKIQEVERSPWGPM